MRRNSQKMENLLTFSRSDDPVQLDCELNLKKLYPSPRERENFEGKLHDFLSSDRDNSIVYELDGDCLRYRTEHLIPTENDGRTPLLLIFGNPASHSITSGMFFSPKNDREENRFWEHLLGKVGIDGLSLDKGLTTTERNKERLQRLMTGDYGSDFRVGLCVFISMPSSAGGDWSGVAGIRKLLGKRAFDEVAKEERERILEEAARFLHPNGFGVTFQKDAWLGLSSSGNYSLEQAKSGELKGTFKGLPGVPLFGAPPTRLLGPCRKTLLKFLNPIFTELKRFEIHSGGYLGRSFSLVKDDHQLIYSTFGHGYSLEKLEKTNPSPQDWREFFKTLDQIDIWRWKSRYENPGILDGSSWKVAIELENRKLDSSGSNNFPDNFDILLECVRKLIGGSDFY
jgi:hypothetical protein